MKKFKLILLFLSLLIFANANTLNIKNLNDKNLTIEKSSFKILEFEKMIESIKVSDKKLLEVDFVNNEKNPLKAIKLFAKNTGNANILISFIDSSSIHLYLDVIDNLKSLIEVAKTIEPELIIEQINGKIILKGMAKNKKVKTKIVDLFKKAGVDTKNDLIDLITLKNPSKMIRIKLYAVEISNSDGIDIKHNWIVSSKNYVQYADSNGNLYNVSSNSVSNTNAQRNNTLSTALDSMLANAVTLSGGLTSAANYLGRYFNTALTLNYLSSKGVAKVLDETTLLTLENQKSTFHAGGTIYLKVATTTSEGVPTTEVQNINYGLQLDINAQNIVNDEFVNLNIVTKSTGIDWSNTIDEIPSFTEKSIKTNVVVGNQSTIILGGLVTSKNSEDISKIPVLGDIPILGNLFTSKSFKEGKSELVFFITPEIVSAKGSDEIQALNSRISFSKDKASKED